MNISAALGVEGVAELVRRQRETARRYGEHEVAESQTAWLVENGHEPPTNEADRAVCVTSTEGEE